MLKLCTQEFAMQLQPSYVDDQSFRVKEEGSSTIDC
jgi:hypothetical protein